MRPRTLLFVATVATILAVAVTGTAAAAHFSATGTADVHFTVNSGLAQYQWCNFNYTPFPQGIQTTTIDPDGTEKAGDPVTMTYCYGGSGTTVTPGSRYVVVAGIGDSTSFSVGCLPTPAYTPFSKPATIILNPGQGQTTLASYGPVVLTGNDSVSLSRQCDTVQLHIGDRLNIDFGTFALLYDTQQMTNPDVTGSSASINYTIDAALGQPTAVPTLSEWGFLALALFAGLGGAYCLRRQAQVRA